MGAPATSEMPEKVPVLEASYKARAVEGFLDIYFYRKIGYQLALLFARLRLKPAHVTLCGAVLGIMAGYFYSYPDLRLNVLGMFLHILSNAFDNADGQLARLTKSGSRTGRALDGLADNLVFISIYAYLCLRYTAGGGSPLVWLLALTAGASHSLQSAAADYFRNAYLYFAEGKARSELDASDSLQTEFDRLRWPDQPGKKLLLSLYLNYTRLQEWLAPRMDELKRAAVHSDETAIAEAYRQSSRPLITWLNLLATNPRMILLFVLLFAGQPAWYFVVELTAFNFLLLLLLRREHAICSRILDRVAVERTRTLAQPAVD